MKGRTRDSVLWENRQNMPLDGYISGKSFYEPEFLHLPILGKSLKSLTEMPVPRDQQQPSTETCV